MPGTVLAALALVASAVAADGPSRNEQAVHEVECGLRHVADATWWGYDPHNATAALQGAIDSGAPKVIVPDVGSEWVVDPISLASDQEIVFEQGVVVAARPGGFAGLSDSLLKADRKHNITIRGYGATLRMQKPEYTKGEWRMCLEIDSCTNVRVLGLTLRDSGGDGIYLGDSDPEQPYCRDVLVRDCTFDNHRRQGMSVISAVGLAVERCVFRNTAGTAPQAGVDLEPNLETERLVDCVFRDCAMEDNRGPGILVYLGPLTAKSEPVDIRFEGCRVTSSLGSGIEIGGTRAPGPVGRVIFRDCRIDDCARMGLNLFSWASRAVRADFDWCTWRSVARADSAAPPLQLEEWDSSSERVVGGADFRHCVVVDDRDRPSVAAVGSAAARGVADLHGDITLRSPYAGRMVLGPICEDVALTLRDEPRG
jgi:hypothetical protein